MSNWMDGNRVISFYLPSLTFYPSPENEIVSVLDFWISFYSWTWSVTASLTGFVTACVWRMRGSSSSWSVTLIANVFSFLPSCLAQ